MVRLQEPDPITLQKCRFVFLTSEFQIIHIIMYDFQKNGNNNLQFVTDIPLLLLLFLFLFLTLILMEYSIVICNQQRGIYVCIV